MDYSTYGQPWQQQQQTDNRLPIKAQPLFFYKHHPENWEIIIVKTKKGKSTIEKPYWVPKLHKQKLSPGVNGARMNGKQVDGTLAKARAQDSGFIILEPNKLDYIRVYPAWKGNHHASKFTTLEKVGNRIIETFDMEAFNAFRLDLLKNQYIKLPHPVILKEKIIELQKMIERKSSKSHIPEQKKSIDILYKRKDWMKEAMEGIETQGLAYYD